MKHLICFLSILLLASNVKSQTWQPLGPDNRDELGFDYSKLLWLQQNADTLYAGLVTSNHNKVVIKKFDGQKWNVLGSSYDTSMGYINVNSLTMSKTHEPYLATWNATTGSIVSRYSNGAWTQVGGSLPDTTYVSSIDFGKADTTYVVLVNSSTQLLSVVKLTGTTWSYVGDSQFVSISPNIPPVLSFDTAGVPYIAYSDPNFFYRAAVMKFQDTAWVSVSPYGGLSTLVGSQFEMEFDKTTNLLYLKYADAATGATVQKYDGNTWSLVGTSFSGTIPDDFCVSNSGVPYLLFRKYDSLQIRKFDGTNWVVATTTVRGLALSNDQGYITLLQDSIPVVGTYLRNFNGNPVVSKYTNASWTKVGTYGFASEGANSDFYTGMNRNMMQVVVTSDSIPHVAISDNAYGGKLSLMKYVNGSWVYEGTPGFTAGYPIDFIKGKNDSLYLLYVGAGGCKLARIVDTNIVNIDSGVTTASYLNNVTLALDTAGAPYLTFPDPVNFNITTIKKLVNGSWTTVKILPCTTKTQIEFNSKNEVYAMYSPSTSSSTLNLVKWVNNAWVLQAQQQNTEEALFKIDHKDSVYMFSEIDVFIPSGNIGGAMFRIWKLYQLTNSNSWTQIATIDSINYNLNIRYRNNNIVFDTASTPYYSSIFGREPKLECVGVGPMLAGGGAGWDSAIRVNNFDVTIGPDNKLVCVYSYGAAYAMSFQPGVAPPAPQVVSPVYYCQGDSAAPLIAYGQNLLWSQGSTINSSTVPVPSTAVPGTYVWYVRQKPSIYWGAQDTITVIVYPKPALTAIPTQICLGDTAVLSTPAISGATYNWTKTQLINGVPVTTSFLGSNSLSTTDSGIYTVTVTPNGCTSYELPVSLSPTQVADVTLDGPTAAVAVGQLVNIYATFNNNIGAGYSVKWYVNGVFNTLTNNVNFQYQKLPGTDTVYAEIIPSPLLHCYLQGMSDTILISDATNIEELLQQNGLKVYPNPVADQITLEGLGKDATMFLYTTDGKMINSWKSNGAHQQNFSTAQLLPGMYYLKIVTNRKTIAVPLSKL